MLSVKQGKYKILFIGYWNADDGLTSSTIIPHLRLLRQLPTVNSVFFVNTQREKCSEERKQELNEITDGYFPVYSKPLAFAILTKIVDFIRFPAVILSICEKRNINFIIARGTPAGALAWLVWKKKNVSYLVESFEPHAEYMRCSNTWKRYDLRYLFQSHWEKMQKVTAQFLVVVSENYKKQLLKEGVSERKVKIAPCGVDPLKFYPNEDLRLKTRAKLGISSSAVAGIYVGKFGGLYEEDLAFKIFERCFQVISDFYLILLSSNERAWIQKKLNERMIPLDRVVQTTVPHTEVNCYLNAADFGYALYKSNKVSSFLSPVKIGECWAAGLPVLITENVGDESSFIEEQQLGIILRIPSFFADNSVFKTIDQLIKVDKKTISKKGLSIRTFEKVANTYKEILS